MKNTFRSIAKAFTTGNKGALDYSKVSALFFLSTGRTGTTTVAKALQGVVGVQSFHELKPHLFDSRYHIYQEGDVHAPWIEKDFKEKRWQPLSTASQSGDIFVESSAFLSFHTPQISRAITNSRFVFMHRNPEEFVVSGLRRNWYESHPNDHVRLTPRIDDIDREKWSQYTQFEKICWLWANYNSFCLSCYEQLPEHRRIILPSDDLWGSPRESAEKLCQLVDLDSSQVDIINRDLRIKHNAQLTGQVTGWAEWTNMQREAFERICGPVMARLGYPAK